MFERNPDGFSLTFVNGIRVVVSFEGRDKQRYIRADTYSPGGSLMDAGHYSVDHLAETLGRIAQQASGYTPEELAEMNKS